MTIISKLFGKSPFEPLYQHMLKVKECVDLVKPLMESFINGEQDKVEKYAKQIFKAEHKADLVKKEIRNLSSIGTGLLLQFLKKLLSLLLCLDLTRPAKFIPKPAQDFSFGM